MKKRNLKEQFASMQKESLKSTESTSGGFEDKTFVKFKPGHKYEFRLMWSIPDDSERNDAFIYTCKHTHFDKAADVFTEVPCPVSVHIQNTRGFSTCPVCKSAKKAYKDWNDNGIASAEETYKTAKRKQNGYVYVYVIKDSLTPENEGTMKIMHMTYTMYKLLMLKVFGVDIKPNYKDTEEDKERKRLANLEDAMGEEAFDIVNGYNMKITTTQAEGGENWNDYDVSFSRKPSDLSKVLTEEFQEAAMKELTMDERFYSVLDMEALEKFNEDFILGQAQAKADSAAEAEEIPMNFDNEEEEAPSEPVKTADADDEEDLDDLLADLV